MTPTPTPAALIVDTHLPRSSHHSPNPSTTRATVHVAVGILVQPDGRYLLTTRPAGKAYAGYWEFPGGKIEAGETVEQALRRELQEEIGITITTAPPWRELVVDYPHALVHLHFCQIRHWRGTLHMREGQNYAWQHLPVTLTPILPGTVPVLTWLQETAPGQQETTQNNQPLGV